MTVRAGAGGTGLTSSLRFDSDKQFGDLIGTSVGTGVSITASNSPSSAITVAVGDLLLVNFVEEFNLTATTCTDNLGNTFTPLQSADTGNSSNIGYYSIITAAGASTPVVAATASSDDFLIQCVAFKGPFGGLDINLSQTQASESNPAAPATGTLSTARELIICHAGVTATDSWSVPLPTGAVIDLQTSGSGVSGIISHINVNSTSTVTMSFTEVSGRSGLYSVATFKGETGQRTAVLAAAGNVIADTKLYQVAFASLPGTADLVTSASLALVARATLPSIADILADALESPSFATLSGNANIVADAVIPSSGTAYQISAVWAGGDPGGPVANYQFNDGTANDSSGNGYNASTVGSPIYTNGKVQLNGAEYFTVADNPTLSVTGNITLVARIKVDTFDQQWQAIIAKGDNSYRLARSSTTNVLNFAANGLTPNNLDGSVNVNDGLEHHVVAVYDGSRMYLYVDGVLDTSAPASGTINDTGADLWIGNNSDQVTRQWKGTLDDVRVYNRALSAFEVARLYSGLDGSDFFGDLTRIPIFATAVLASGVSAPSDSLAAFWSFNADSAADDSGNGRTGTLNNSPTFVNGPKGRAISFDGSATQYVSVTNDASLNYTNAKTVALWINAASLGTLPRFINQSDDANNGWSIAIDTSVGNVFSISYTRGGGTDFYTVAGAVNTGQDYHIAWTNSGSAITGVYVNGIFQSDAHAGTGLANGTANELSIGRRTDNARYFNGTVDDVRIYSRELSAAEILNVYNDGIGNVVIANATVVTQGFDPTILATLAAAANFFSDTALYMVANATLPGIASLIANPALYSPALATLNGVGNLIAATRLSLTANAVLPGVASIIANPALYSVMRATWPLSGDVLANATLLAASSFVAGIYDETGTTGTLSIPTAKRTELEFGLILDTGALGNNDTLDFRVYQTSDPIALYGVTPRITFTSAVTLSNAVWPGSASILANPLLFSVISAVLPGSATIIADTVSRKAILATLNGSGDLIANIVRYTPTTAVLAGNADILANATALSLVTAVLPGVGNLLANAFRYSPISAVLPGVANILANPTQIWSSAATLPGVGNIVAATTLALTANSVWPGVANLIANGFIFSPISAVLVANSSLIANILRYIPATAVLAGSADIIALATLAAPSSTSVWAGVGNIITNPFLSMSATAVLPGNANVIAASTMLWASTAVLNGVGNLVANITLVPNTSSAVWSGVANVITNPRLFTPISAVLASTSTLIASTSLALPARATLPGVAFITVDTQVYKPASAVFAGVGNLLANAIKLFPASTAVLAGVATLIASARLRIAAYAQLDGTADIIAYLAQSAQVTAFFNGIATVRIDALVVQAPANVVVPPGGNSGFYGPNAYLDDLPAPDRRLKKRKQRLKPLLPPEAFIKEPPAPLPPLAPIPAFRLTKPLATFKTPVEDYVSDLRKQIMDAHDESDRRDAMQILRGLLRESAVAKEPPPLQVEPEPKKVPLPNVKPSPVTDYDKSFAVPVRSNNKLTGMSMGDRHLSFARDPVTGLVTGGQITHDPVVATPQPQAPAPVAQKVPLPNIAPMPTDPHTAVPLRENNKLTGMSMGDKSLTFARDPHSGLVTGAKIMNHNTEQDQQDAATALRKLGLVE